MEVLKMNEALYNKAYTCPVCGNHFNSSKVKSEYAKVERADTDLFKYYAGNNPYLYEIKVCPGCGFSFAENFHKEVSPVHKKSFLEKVSMNWNKHDYCGERDIEQAIETFKLALLSGQMVEMKSSVLGGICHRIACLYRMCGNSTEEDRFLSGAVQFYTQAYSVEDFQGADSVKPEIIVYLLGELSFRIKDYRQSARWFELAITKYCRDPQIKKGVENMIRSRWMDVKDEIVKAMKTTE
jgi:uncharacterized protein (DUF2225 family)